MSSIQTEAQRLGACPQCGAKLPDVPVSLCPYCASPLETRADRELRASVHSARIGRVREHKDFPEASQWTPPEGPTYQRGLRLKWWGLRAVAGGGVAFLVSALQGPSGMLSSPLTWLGLAAGGFGAWMLRRATQDLNAGQGLPLLTRPALILDRRSVTEVQGWSGRTVYFFKMEFEDGAQGEFSFPGLGPQEDPYATNLPGIAYTRGQELLYFRHVRV